MEEDRIFQIITNRDDISWQSMLYGVVKQEGMDPWDIDVSRLARRYIEMLKQFSDLDFKVSGKVVLAAAILLRIKSKRLVGEDITELDRMLAGDEGAEDSFYDELEGGMAHDGTAAESYPGLSPNIPQPRQRKISVYDLVKALGRALEVKNRRTVRNAPIHATIPERKIDVTKAISDLYNRIIALAAQDTSLTFNKLLPSSSKHDRIYTFIPLLHLANCDQRKIDLVQDEHFGEIRVVPVNGSQEAAAVAADGQGQGSAKDKGAAPAA